VKAAATRRLKYKGVPVPFIPHESKRSISVASRLAVLLLLMFIVTGLAGCIETQKSKEQAIAKGKTLFELHCCGCHNGRRSDLAKLPPNLAGIFQRAQLPSGRPAVDAQVRVTILEGRSAIMPSFQETFSDEDIDDILRYLHSVGPETKLCAAN
jgi:mono/diheme cytochrome c family protein